MRSHSDFGRGRLRYNRENKKRIDELWEEVASALNCAGCGPQKLPKEWAKTWRDWKSNLLKRVATYKSYAASTGGGPPKILDTSPSEDDLLEFLTPEASGMSDIPEGGAIGDNNFTSTLTAKETLMSQNLQDLCSQTKKMSCSQRPQNVTPSLQINVEENLFRSDVINVDDTENSINISSNVLASIENVQTPKQVHCNNSNTISIKNKRYSDDKNINNKKIKQNVKHLLEQHTSDYSNIQERMLQLKEEKLAVAKEELELKKKAYQENNEHLISLVEKVDELTNIIRSIAPQYLE